jgi:hypothetical protein
MTWEELHVLYSINDKGPAGFEHAAAVQHRRPIRHDVSARVAKAPRARANPGRPAWP